MKFACLGTFGAILGYALVGTIEAALIAGVIAFYLAGALADALVEQGFIEGRDTDA